ncbi:MAG: alpha amylase C-terminal domain-containing protein, partial [Duncaniella sp.]|nr:alpha amylase C-terminal domain-containing protein [Duncaniella sp.]
DQVLAFMRGDLVFVFNFNPSQSFTGNGVLAPAGEYDVVLSTDNPAFGGYGNIDETVSHLTITDPLFAPSGREWLKLYMPPRSAMVLKIRRPEPPHTKKEKKTTSTK